MTDFTLMAWDTFRARVPYDEARRLALAVGGLDVGELERGKILVAKSGNVRLLPLRSGSAGASTGSPVSGQPPSSL